MLLNGLIFVVIPKKFHHKFKFFWKRALDGETLSLYVSIILTSKLFVFSTKNHSNGINVSVVGTIDIRWLFSNLEKLIPFHWFENEISDNIAGVETTFRPGRRIIVIQFALPVLLFIGVNQMFQPPHHQPSPQPPLHHQLLVGVHCQKLKFNKTHSTSIDIDRNLTTFFIKIFLQNKIKRRLTSVSRQTIYLILLVNK